MPASSNVQSRPSTARGKSLVPTLTTLAKTLQFYWFIGHLLSISFFIGNMFYSFFNKSKSLNQYRLSLFFVIITYSIVIKQIHFKTNRIQDINKKVLNIQFFKDENVQYLSLAIVLLLTSFKIGAISGGLYSFTIFSLFHVLSYFQNYILNSLPISISNQQLINSRINFFTSNYNKQALTFASNSEIFLPIGFLFRLPFLLFKIFRDPLYVIIDLFTFAFVIVFVKLRFNDNPYTQSIVNELDMKIKTIVNHPKLSGYPLSAIYEQNFKPTLTKYIGPIQIPNTVKKTQ